MKKQISEVTCTDCPFTKEDKAVRQMTDAERQKVYAKYAHQFKHNVIEEDGKVWLEINHPCDAMKAVSYKCQTRIDIISIIDYLGSHYDNKNLKDLSVADYALLLANTKQVNKFSEKFFKNKNKNK